MRGATMGETGETAENAEDAETGKNDCVEERYLYSLLSDLCVLCGLPGFRFRLFGGAM